MAVIREYRNGDFSRLHELDSLLFPPGVSYSRLELRYYIFQRGSQTFVAQEKERAVGFIVVRKERDAGHVITIDVEPAHQDRGVGSQLMEAGEGWLRRENVREVYLETAEDNQKAIAFFRRWGYETVRRISGYYADGKDAYLMRKKTQN